jgi:phi13 family phage major tail protein
MAVEFRGCKRLVFAEVTKDNNESGASGGYTTGTVKVLAPVAEISKTVETSAESKYYDNKAAIVINSEGADTVSFTIAIPDDEILAEITGRTYDSTKKMFIESERETKYFAVGYILGEKGEGDDERYVWRYKGTFNIPDETSATENDGTDSNNMTLEYTGIYTDHEFTNGKGTGVKGAAKASFIRESNNVATADEWFAAVATPDSTFT